MKIKNIFICILNIIEVLILALLTETILDYIHIYSLYMFMLRVVWYITGLINLIYGIINIKKKKTAIGILFIIIGVITLATILINHTELVLDFDYEIPVILNYVILAISGILSIVILILNRKSENDKKNKVVLAFSIVLTIINIFLISFISVIHFSNVNNFQEYIAGIKSEDDQTTYILKDINECSFLDENGQVISQTDCEYVATFLKFNINGIETNIINLSIDDTEVLTNNRGDELFRLKTGIPINNISISIPNLTDDDSIFSNGTTLISFLYYIADTGKYDFERTNTYSISYENIDFSYNALNKYDERDNQFEDNPNCTYLYFKNEDFSNFTLQVVINNGVESADNDILNFYSENCGYIQYIDYTKMDDFYNYQKEFYLIDFHGNTRVKLDCNNLFYEALNGIDNDAERIILLSNGYIPFYDEDENGYFNLMGQKVTVAPNYLLYDVVDDNIVLIDKQTNHTIIVSSESNNIIKEFDYIITRYNGFFIAYFYNDSDIIFNNDFNVIVRGNIQKLVGDKFITINNSSSGELMIYSYDGNNINRLNTNFLTSYSSLTSSDNSISISSNIYTNIGIVESRNE